MEANESVKPGLPVITSGRKFEIDPFSAKTNLVFLLALFALTIAGIGIPLTREFTLLILAENNAVEVLTFAVFLIGGAYGLKFSYALFKEREDLPAAAFYLVFSAGLIFIGLEEISWGQQFFGFATPESLRAMNDQGETTIHNIRGMSGNSEYLRLVFGIGGAIGVLLSSYKPFRKIAAPVFLMPWFLLITGHALVDVFNDIRPVQKHFDALVSELAELVEMLIACSALIYIYFNLKKYMSDA
jgi:hypothetical protein